MLNFDLTTQCINFLFKYVNMKTKLMMKNLFVLAMLSYFETVLNLILLFLLILLTTRSQRVA